MTGHTAVLQQCSAVTWGIFHTCHTGTAEHLDAGRAYLVTVIAINKKGASTAVYQTVETVQQPELQLVEEKIEQEPDIAESDLILGVGVGVGLCLVLLLLAGLWVRHWRCGRAGPGPPGDGGGIGPGHGQQLTRKSILKKQQSCDSSPDLIPHQDHENWNFLAGSKCNEMMQPEEFEESSDFNQKKSTATSLLSIKSNSRDGLLLLNSSETDLEEVGGLFPNKISTSTLKRGSSCKRTYLLKEKRESIV